MVQASPLALPLSIHLPLFTSLILRIPSSFYAEVYCSLYVRLPRLLSLPGRVLDVVVARDLGHVTSPAVVSSGSTVPLLVPAKVESRTPRILQLERAGGRLPLVLANRA